jgi:hypothetical protein
MITNYLDLLDDDLMSYILNIVANMYDDDISKIDDKLKKVKQLTNKLSIDVDEEEKITYISYDNISYSCDKYLYSRYPADNVIIVHNIIDTDIILKSNVLKSPIYLDILREVNKIYNKQTQITGYEDEHTFLEDISPVRKHEIGDYNI